MALLVISGQPCSGKSTVAAELTQMLVGKGLEVIIIDEPGLSMTRNQSYRDTVSEKNTRGKLKSAVERSISKRHFIILDSLNNIKGYRYELWCIARAAGTRCCVVHCAVPKEQAWAWNEERAQGKDAYSAEVFEDLWRRYEEPDARQRWDAPLFRLAPDQGKDTMQPVLQGVVESLTEEAGPRQRSVVAKQLQPTQATTNAPLSATNLLHEIDGGAQDVIGRICAAQELAGSSAAGRVQMGEEVDALQLNRPVTLAELRRHKRVFLKMSTQSLASRLPDRQSARRMFVNYLREHLD
ncbi:chromatin associated protein KTI12 [Coccomyxa subellipsoidea C-169]|uniref:Protein KTI12 homolog n=1 Tax=Coccomyxa subellipsoidea (strain C-169) TaxID=574566 RepID=I0YJE5_COCSC|nr:chromatin associated protein KTI12 [Coccomyxa subellipsoidea C-169]EIE18514.1 chromatin associated protein KTI12 [Coccomyxa subellipsoidea C-169]|eukprot:XP_005643058.1 chromatin associated protein KTI12 [Coccomyxa subellipsoidea C-169]